MDLDLQPGHGAEEELYAALLDLVDRGIGLLQQRFEVLAQQVDVGGEDQPQRQRLPDGLVRAVAPDEHLVRHAEQRGHVAPELVQQPGQVLALLEVDLGARTDQSSTI